MSKRDDILDATLALIHEEGLQSTTFSKIFKRAGVGSGTVYNYFGNKGELVEALFVRTIGLFNDFIMQGYDREQSVYECFRCILINMASFWREHQMEMWFLENYTHSPYIAEEVRERDLTSMVECLLLFERGVNQGLFRKANGAMCMNMINGMISSVVQGAVLGKYPLEEAQFEQVIEMCWRAILV